MSAASLAVFEYHLVGYRRTWRGSIFSSVLLPLLYVLGIGVGVGRYVDAGSGLTVPYLDYVVPGLLAATAFNTGFGESSFPVFSRFQWIRTYDAIRASPAGIADMITGQLGWVAFRAATTAAVFVAITAAFGTVHSWWGPASLPVAVLVALAVAAPVTAFSAAITSDSHFAVVGRFVVVPMTLFAGVFFPVSSLPTVLRPVAYASPLWHGVELCRAATLGTGSFWPAVGHVAYLVAWVVGGYLLALVAFRRRLAV